MAKRTALLMLLFILPALCIAETADRQNPAENGETITIEIHHCPTCGFRAKAESLAQELSDAFGVQPKLVTGEIGSFDVYVNGDLIFSKADAGRFPKPGEIVQRIDEYLKK